MSEATNTAAPPPAPQQAQPPAQRVKAGSLASVTSGARKMPSRIVLHAIPKWGKSSFAAHAPKPIFLMTRGEDGLVSLIDAGLVPPTDHYPDTFVRWAGLMDALKELAGADHPYRTLVLDTLNGAERLACEATCAAECDGSWEKFDAYGRGVKLTQTRIIQLTTALDACRERGMGVLLLAHSQVRTFKNPSGPDYDRWEPVLAKESWAHLDRWADMILFGQFEMQTDSKGPRGSKAKATGGQQRMLMTERRAEYDAGNRAGLPEEISGGTCAAEAWSNFRNSLKKERA